MAKASKRRRPGAGRPPAGPISGKVSTFSTRITAETRDALETERKASGQSISQIAERLLNTGLAQVREQQTIAPTRALRFLVGRLADASSIKPGARRFEWYEDRFTFEAFRVALMILLEQLRPKNSDLEKELIDGNEPWREMWREILASPETLGRSKFLEIWDHLQRVKPTTVTEAMSFTNEASAIAWSRYSYTIDDVRRDLFGEKKS
jgi:formate dehydrogenase maturation protein FdhE